MGIEELKDSGIKKREAVKKIIIILREGDIESEFFAALTRCGLFHAAVFVFFPAAAGTGIVSAHGKGFRR